MRLFLSTLLGKWAGLAGGNETCRVILSLLFYLLSFVFLLLLILPTGWCGAIQICSWHQPKKLHLAIRFTLLVGSLGWMRYLVIHLLYEIRALYLNEADIADLPLLKCGTALNPTEATVLQIWRSFLSCSYLQLNDVIASLGWLQLVPYGQVRGRWIEKQYNLNKNEHPVN